MKYGTSAYQTETPKLLWVPFKNGPAASEDRCADRLTELQAFDLLVHTPDALNEEQRQLAEDVLDDSFGDLAVLLDLVRLVDDVHMLHEELHSADTDQGVPEPHSPDATPGVED